MANDTKALRKRIMAYLAELHVNIKWLCCILHANDAKI